MASPGKSHVKWVRIVFLLFRGGKIINKKLISKTFNATFSLHFFYFSHNREGKGKILNETD